MSGSDPDEEFKVIDRRRRTEDDEPVRTGSPTSGPAPAARDRPDAAPPPQDWSPQASAPGTPTLEGLFLMLASSAAMAMGDAPDAAGQVQVDPAMASDAIDLLILLRQKTQGNRTPEETQLLDELIYDLQLRYVAALRRHG